MDKPEILEVGERVLHFDGSLLSFVEIAEANNYCEGESYAFTMYRLKGSSMFSSNDQSSAQTYHRSELFRLSERKQLREHMTDLRDRLKEYRQQLEDDFFEPPTELGLL